MRYLKGSLDLNFQDRELLHLVADAQYITHSQLFELMRLKTFEARRPIFNWRTRRLVNSGLLRKLVVPQFSKNALYSITEAGVEALEMMGVTYLGGYVEHDAPPDKMRVSHLLEINEIRIALEHSGALVSWTAEAFIRVLKLSPSFRYAKTYDAVARVHLGNDVCVSVAIEFERSLKGKDRYQHLVEVLATEERVQAILFLTTSFEVSAPLRRYLRGTRPPALLGRLDAFKKSMLDAEVEAPGSYSTVQLREALSNAVA